MRAYDFAVSAGYRIQSGSPLTLVGVQQRNDTFCELHMFGILKSEPSRGRGHA